MGNVIPFRKDRPCIEVVEEDQEITRSFDLESFALTYAEGQRIRLGLVRL
jgi:hypothetical protein